MTVEPGSRLSDMGKTAYEGDERREFARPYYCFETHEKLSERVGSVESEVKVIKERFSSVEKEVNLMSSLMTTIQKNTNDTNAAMQRLAAEMGGVKTAIEIRHEYESKARDMELKHTAENERRNERSAFMEVVKNSKEVVLLVAGVSSLFGIAWAVIMHAKSLP